MTMNKITAADTETRSEDIIAGNVEQLAVLFPEAFTEGKIDFTVLRQLLGEAVDDREEKYGLNWFGKRKARQLALTPSTGTLRPCPDDSVDWDTTQNIMIEGDNLEVLKLMQKSYSGRVKLIYIDPPYNTGKDFVYPDDYQDSIKNYLEITGQIEGGKKISSNTESSGRYHTDWLNMMYPRLKMARNLLSDDGILVVSIDDNEIDRLRVICAEIFGEENFAAQITVQSNPRGRQSDTYFATVHDYLLVYVKNTDHSIIRGAALTEEQKAEFNLIDNNGKAYRLLGLRQRGSASFREDRPDMYFPIHVNPTTLEVSLDPKPGFSQEVFPRKSTGEDGRWMWGKEKCRKDINLLVPRFIQQRSEFDIFVIDYLDKGDQERTRKFKSIWDDKKFNTQNGTQEVKELLGCGAMQFPKPVALLEEILQFGVDDNDIVLDFFAGSGTTGHAVMSRNGADQQNRRFILVQLPEPLDPTNKDQKVAADFCNEIGKPQNLSEITKERLRRAARKVQNDNPLLVGNLGFRVFKLDSSNIQAWEVDRHNLPLTLENAVQHLITNRSEADILYELLLKLGLDLCVPIEPRAIVGKTVHSIGKGTLLVCLAEHITREEAEQLALGMVSWHKELAPAGSTICVFRDSGFADDVAKSNLAAILDQYGLSNVRSL